MWNEKDLDATGKKYGVALQDLSRYDMVKSRVW